ncbi:hypothetical protein [Streptomyces sp. NRRL S-241]|uniref:hypothetical protein n=1 Tax=Streptomyces sp. NRRL S-241 TaxID=1463896 RepID=UPI000690AAE6|nr:hypothetical protein [Streptomyces sp. NRRL S-241]
MTVRGRFLAPDGTPLSGALVFRAPATLTFPQADVILGGPVTVQLDAQGAIEVTLPATDAPDMDPSGWAYVVAEQLSGILVGRSYNIVLPRAQPEVDLADIAPTDPAKPNYVGVPGPVGPQGATGTPGSRIYSGATAPAAGLGVDGDLYVRYETSTVLGVASTTVSTWQRTAGAWAQIGGDVRGAAIYTNNTTTPSTNTKPGDLLIRTDTGDLWQRNASGWGSAIGSLRGPKGDKGDVGAAGATGPGGVVQSVNGKSAAAVTLSAADVGALATTAAGAPSGVATLGADGKVPAAQLPAAGGGAVDSVNSKTGVVVLTAADVGALDQAAADARYPLATAAVLVAGTQTISGGKTFSSIPSTTAAPTTANHLTRKSYVDALGGGEWLPSDHGLLTWAFDPALGQSTALYPGSGPIRVTAVILRVPVTVARIVWFATGYAGGLTTGSWAAIYDSAGTRVAATGDMSTATYEPAEVHNAGGATISSPLTASYAAPAGVYYVASRWQYNTGTGDGPMLLAAESSAGAPPNQFGQTAVRRFGVYSTGAATAPATINVASMENGANRFWCALG